MSEPLPEGGRPGRPVAYGPGPEQVAEFYEVPDPAAVVLFLHGGYWRARYDRSHARPLATALADAGYAVLLAEYRRVGQPGGGYPGTLEDVATLVDTLPAAVAPGRPLILAGHSAGGQLALWAAARRSLPPGAPGAPLAPVAIAGVVALAPVADLRVGAELGLGDGAIEDFLGGSPGSVPERYAIADPTGLPRPAVPVTILHGEADDVVTPDVSRNYAADGRADLILIPGADHFGVITPGSREWPRVLTALSAQIYPF
ncbi:alpha/beta hydrolase family protein [Cryptosporangium arvum]|uniref:Esterase/lipase n=1 Tax=Cryptosporangium arvum DSM 44712 TaxID=927661 RepID=A0A010ZQ52_9ACTN|nr:alpha/beta hydrolase [Cryptosporangium arvum]EXG80779.1 esterase/lipase [Cryptosporangium arvum DSM 44712]